MLRARIRVDGRLAGGLQALLGAPMAAYSGCGQRDGGIGHGKRRSRTGLARVGGDVQLAGTLGQLQAGRQAGGGMARSRARARLNWVSQGQPWGRCRVKSARRAGEASGQGEEAPAGGSWWSRSAHPGRCGRASGPATVLAVKNDWQFLRDTNHPMASYV